MKRFFALRFSIFASPVTYIYIYTYGIIFCQAVCINSKYNKYRKWQSHWALFCSNIHMVHCLTTVAKVMQYISCLVMVAITLLLDVISCELYM